MGYFKNTPYNKKYKISHGGSWQAHLKRGDVGIDRPVPCRTRIFNVFKKVRIRRRNVFVPPWSSFKPWGVRKVVQMIELDKHNKPTGRIFEVWHINKLAPGVKNKIVKGREYVAMSGSSGSYSCHVHEVAYHAKTGKPFNHKKEMEIVYIKEALEAKEAALKEEIESIPEIEEKDVIDLCESEISDN